MKQFVQLVNFSGKYILLITIISMLSIISCDQKNTPNLEAPLTWKTQLPGSSADNLIQCRNEDFVVWNSGDLLRLSTRGEVIWSESVSLDIKDKFLTETLGGDILVAGDEEFVNNADDQEEINAIILKCDEHGKEVWRSYPLPKNIKSICRYLKEDEKGSFLAACVSLTNNMTDSVIHVYHLNMNGLAQEYSSITLPEIDHGSIRQLIINSRNELVFTYLLYEDPSFSLEIYCVDLEGNIKWKLNPQNDKIQNISKILEKEDHSGFVFFGSDHDKANALSISGEGKIEWETTWNSGGDWCAVYGATTSMKNNGYSLIGSVSKDNNSDIWFVQLNNDGSYNQDLVFESDIEFELGSNIIKTLDGYFAICGTKGNSSFIYKTNTDGTFD